MASESYLVQLLSDSNLPTGGFIASGGLESYHAHGFLPPHDTVSTTLSFVEHTLANYAASVLPYMCAAYRLSRSYIEGHDDALDALCRLDWHHHTLLLNHVSRRASLIQGIALLTLYVRSFSSALQDDSARADALVEELRRRTASRRRPRAPIRRACGPSRRVHRRLLVLCRPVVRAHDPSPRVLAGTQPHVLLDPTQYDRAVPRAPSVGIRSASACRAHRRERPV